VTEYFVAKKFLGMTAAAVDAEWIYVGLPMDFTASFQPGSRFGPPRIREASYGLETYSLLLDRDLEDVSVADVGDLEFAFGNVSQALTQIGEAAQSILAEGKRFVAVGGEHLVTLPLIQAVVSHYPDLVVVHWDAHADLRDTYLGERLSHATVLRRVAELLRPGHLYQFGIRSGTREEMVYAKAHTHLYPEAVLAPLTSVMEELKGRPLYVTIDLDVIDPGFFPGTGTPEPGGISAAEALSALRLLGGLNVVGMDFVETMPLPDVSQRTAVLAAKMIRDALLTVTRPR
jgi:agmatinase